MEENQIESTVESTEPRSQEKKNYHPPELTDYGNLREMTLTSVSGPSTADGGDPLELTTS